MTIRKDPTVILPSDYQRIVDEYDPMTDPDDVALYELGQEHDGGVITMVDRHFGKITVSRAPDDIAWAAEYREKKRKWREQHPDLN